MTLVVGSLQEVARHFSRSLRTAQRWSAAGMPRSGAGWDLAAVETWLRAAKCKGGLAALERERQVLTLLEAAVRELRSGLEDLCRAYARARGAQRQALIDRVVKQLLENSRLQMELELKEQAR